jgi:2-hydroxychromene-2-carboxylate isomerase
LVVVRRPARRADAEEIKRRLQEATEAAIALGVYGVPVELADQLFWEG